MTKRSSKQKQRVVYTYNPNEGSGTSDELESFLLVGDPDYEEYKQDALPRLLAEGWTVAMAQGTGDGNWLLVLDCPS
jgi:hypothetical protein